MRPDAGLRALTFSRAADLALPNLVYCTDERPEQVERRSLQQMITMCVFHGMRPRTARLRCSSSYRRVEGKSDPGGSHWAESLSLAHTVT